MAFARTGPDEAMSKLAEWAAFLGLTKWAHWLAEHAIDARVIRYGWYAMLGLIFLGGILFDRWLSPPSTTSIANEPSSSAPSPVSHYGIAWNFDNLPGVFYLGGGKEKGEEARVSIFQAQGTNVTDDFISCSRGFIRSDLTGAILNLYFVLAGSELVAIPNANPIPPRVKHFLIVSDRFDTKILPDRDKPDSGIRISKIISDFGGFQFYFECDKGIYKRHFSTDDIRELSIRYDKSLETEPEITKKP